MLIIKFINDNHYTLEEKTDIYNFLESMNKQYILTDFEKNIVLSNFNEKFILYPKIVDSFWQDFERGVLDGSTDTWAEYCEKKTLEKSESLKKKSFQKKSNKSL